MKQEQHPITPPDELVEKWTQTDEDERFEHFYKRICTQAARWGADQRLEAVKHWLITGPYGASIVTGSPTFVADLCDAFKPKPPSLKEQALVALETQFAKEFMESDERDIIRRALEALPD